MAEIKIRMARLSDAEALVDVMTQPQVVWGTQKLPHASAKAWEKYLDGNDPDFEHEIVAEVDGRVVGNAGLDRSRRPRSLHTADFGIAVHDAYQGQGVGRALVAALIDAADRWLNIVRIELEVYADNERAIKLYESFGFVVEGRKRMNAFRDGRYVDSLVMGRIRPDLR